jgi:hypothetical protein
MQLSAIQDNIRLCLWRPTASLDPEPQRIFDIDLINDCQNSLYLSKKLRIVIGMETSDFIL